MRLTAETTPPAESRLESIISKPSVCSIAGQLSNRTALHRAGEAKRARREPRKVVVTVGAPRYSPRPRYQRESRGLPRVLCLLLVVTIPRIWSRWSAE